MERYLELLNKKRHTRQKEGISPIWIPDNMFPHQKYVTEQNIITGRNASFLDTGTGKTLIELVIAYNYAVSTNKRVLILTPLAVAFQFLKEAEKFGISDVSYSRTGELKTKIIIANYERLAKFSPDDFDCVILDESSILKNDKGEMRIQITAFMRKVKYRFLATATPSPNDFIELGTSSEALGGMGYVDMIGRFFTNKERTFDPMSIGAKFYLKPHAEDDFFAWVRSWSISMRKPSDLGFNDDLFVLPNLITKYHEIKNKKTLVVNGQFEMFNRVARTGREINEEARQTLDDRCFKAIELSDQHEVSVYWVNLDKEGDFIEKNDKSAVQLKGPMKIEQKEEILLDFANGKIKRLITKPKITGFGLNWQHCSHTVWFPTFSYEQYYQAVRRFYRYGQKNDVRVDIVHSEGQSRVITAITKKGEKADHLFSKLNESVNKLNIKKDDYASKIELPNFLK